MAHSTRGTGIVVAKATNWKGASNYSIVAATIVRIIMLKRGIFAVELYVQTAMDRESTSTFCAVVVSARRPLCVNIKRTRGYGRYGSCAIRIIVSPVSFTVRSGVLTANVSV
jgi:hypothetical protein